MTRGAVALVQLGPQGEITRVCIDGRYRRPGAERRGVVDDRGRDVEPDFAAFCDCLNRHQVDYLIVGSEAVAVHGAPRYSQDFDTFVRATADNAHRLVAALEEFGFGEANLPGEDVTTEALCEA
jgi:hypothetical protein